MRFNPSDLSLWNWWIQGRGLQAGALNTKRDEPMGLSRDLARFYRPAKSLIVPLTRASRAGAGTGTYLVRGIAFHPAKAGTVYAGTGGDGLFRVVLFEEVVGRALWKGSLSRLGVKREADSHSLVVPS